MSRFLLNFLLPSGGTHENRAFHIFQLEMSWFLTLIENVGIETGNQRANELNGDNADSIFQVNLDSTDSLN